MPILPTWTILGGGYQAYLKGDFAAALGEWYPLAELGDAEAQYNIGVLYDEGAGVQQDYAEAARWYRKAAEQGFVDAQSNLGMMYYYGQGIAQDNEKAYLWFKRAAEQGDAEAAERLQELSGVMTREEIAAAAQADDIPAEESDKNAGEQ
jgi:TPR repeat protein